MKPMYLPGIFSYLDVDTFLDEVPWIKVTDARLECFMAGQPTTYTYGAGRGVRTYTSTEYHSRVLRIQDRLNEGILASEPYEGGQYNVCFLNRYDNARMQLGWHADDTPGMMHTHPIAVVSFGQAREIWWRPNGEPGIVPIHQRQLLEHGSLFLMPKGMQLTHEHRIPKGDRDMGPRVSLTFRRYELGDVNA